VDLRGAYHVAGVDVDDPVVRRIVGDVEGVLSGQRRWTDLLQDVLAAQHGETESEDDERRRRRRKRGRSG
jgi:hypothetical protein